MGKGSPTEGPDINDVWEYAEAIETTHDVTVRIIWKPMRGQLRGTWAVACRLVRLNPDGEEYIYMERHSVWPLRRWRDENAMLYDLLHGVDQELARTRMGIWSQV